MDAYMVAVLPVRLSSERDSSFRESRRRGSALETAADWRAEACPDREEPAEREGGGCWIVLCMMVCDICFKDISSAELFQVKEDELTAKYFSMLSQKDIDRLKQVYRKDFEMFGYTWP